MNFGKYTKTLSFKKIRNEDIKISNLSAQYNSSRFKKYRKVTSSSGNDFLKVGNMPHVEFLKLYQAGASTQVLSGTPYYIMLKKYGHKSKWIRSKMNSFIKLFEQLKEGKLKSPITVVEKPIIKNKYNDGYEIYEGHHRTACYFVMGKKTIFSEIVRAIS